MKRQNIPPDGSCLFTAIDYLITGSFEAGAADRMRAHCAQTILTDPQTYSELYLGQEPGLYADWILNQHNYGGEVEILILSAHYHTRISVVSLESLTVLPYYNGAAEGNGSVPNIYIIYNGQHYDALVSAEDGQHIFYDRANDEAAIAFATTERRARDLMLRTRVRKKLKCICGEIVDDTAAFQAHCEAVDHGEDFGYECEEVEVKVLVDTADDD
jgi:hypothetical protein